jgi:hypothetical protein
MSASSGKTWSPEDQELLRKLWGKKSPTEIGLLLSEYRTRGPVSVKANRLGLPHIRRGVFSGGSIHGVRGAAQLDIAKTGRWSDADTQTLRHLWGKMPYSKIGQQLDVRRGPSPVYSKGISLGLPRVTDLPAVTPEDEQEMVVEVAVDPEFAWSPPPQIIHPPTTFSPPKECQWPMWGQVPVPRPAMFCGEAVHRVDGTPVGSYCPTHHAMAHPAHRER